MAWLMRDGKVLAALEAAGSRKVRRRGLLGRDGFDGALLLRPARLGVHSFGMRFELDVALCDHDLTVRRMVCLRPSRMTRPSLRYPCVIEAEAGAFERWRLRPGDQLEIKE